MAAAAETTLIRSRRRRRFWTRTLQASIPYGLIVPVLAVIGVILGYPLYWLVKLSTQRYGLFELIRHQGVSVGLDNYRSVLHDQIFWHTLLRTVAFTVVNVSLTMVAGMAIALLLVRVSAVVRVLLTSGLVLVWSMPVVVAVQIFYWMTNFQNGIVNYVLTQLRIGDFFQHDWYATTFSQLSLVTVLIVWGALPFVVITLYAGLAQVPHDLVEAAEVDGARPWRVFRDITLADPAADPAHPDEPVDHLGLRRLHPAVPADRSLEDHERQLPDERVPVRGGLLQERLRARRHDLDPDAADGRGPQRRLRPQDGADRRRAVSGPRNARGRRAQQTGWNLVGLALFVVMVFPVFWMISTAFKSNDQIVSLNPTWFPLHPTLQHFRDAIDKPFFWQDVRNSLIVVSVTVAISIVLSFLAAVALARYRFAGRKLFIVLVIGIQMLPQAGLIIPLYVVLARYHQTNALTGLIVTYMTFVLPFSVWTLRGFLLGIPKDLEEAAMVDGSTRLGVFVKILLPLMGPGLVATSVFAFITTWNEYIFARVLLNDQSKQTVTVWLSAFLGSSRHTDWGALMAASTVTAIPVVVFFLLVQRKIAFGLTQGAVRG